MSSSSSITTLCFVEHSNCTTSLCFLFFLLLQKPESQKKRKTEVSPFCFNVSRSTVVDQSFTKKIKNLYKSKTIQSTEYNCVLHKAHLCVVVARKECKQRCMCLMF